MLSTKYTVQIKTGSAEKWLSKHVRLRFVWKFRHTDNRANQQEKVISVEMYKTWPISQTFKLQWALKMYSFQQITATSSHSSKFRLQLMFNASSLLSNACLKTFCQFLRVVRWDKQWTFHYRITRKLCYVHKHEFSDRRNSTKTTQNTCVLFVFCVVFVEFRRSLNCRLCT